MYNWYTIEMVSRERQRDLDRELAARALLRQCRTDQPPVFKSRITRLMSRLRHSRIPVPEPRTV